AVVGERMEPDKVAVAGRVADDAGEVGEGVAPGHMRISGGRGLVGARAPRRRVPAAGGLARAATADALVVGSPRPAVVDELIGERRGSERVHAAAAEKLSLRARRARGEVGVERAVGARLRGRSLPAYQ